ncbi:hypothetical protein M413DRAFT_121554 [Hebeloma cylindrosporum]|uniref:Uncharacterized protein n=1 Tax=Hebeloma cylindrosporum TaxID=76867 RepID=A0A0C2YNT4_HEBCY|nr:hypothetical protein M413DRAFT_121554 [Hebeloma cylindrosporum h7]
MLRGGEPLTSSPPMRSSPFPEPREGEQSSNSNNQQHFNSPSPSQSRSRATSPLRMLRDLSTRLHLGRTAPEERFVPVDPFRSKIRLPFCGLRSHKQHDLENGGDLDSSGAYDCEDLLPVNAIKSWGKDTRIFFLDTLPRELYLNFLLRLPAMYFSRVARIFEDADVSRPDIQRMINNAGGAGGAMPTAPHAVDQNASPLLQDSIRGRLQPGMVPAAGASAAAGAISMMHMPLPFPDEWSPPLVSPALVRFKHSWEDFIDSLLREWKTLNVVSALLASAILTIFQIPEAADDPITRTFAVLSLICALMSLSYGCIYIVRFGTMRSMFHASRWAEDARETKTSIWWNVWVLLATPAIWMAWFVNMSLPWRFLKPMVFFVRSMLLFISAILSFVWRTGSVLDPPDRDPLSARTALGPRILITGVFMLGLVYLGMIIRTLRKYGSYQTSSRALPAMGAGRGTTNEFGKDINNPEVTSVKRPRARDIDAAMERRGRERKRSVSSHVRRREEAAGRGGSVDSGFEDLKLPNLASRSLGVGSRATTPYGELGMDIEMDSKVPGDVSVKKVPIFTR